MMSRTKGADQQRFTYSGLENDIVAVSDGAGALQAKYGRDPFGGLLSLQEGTGPALGTMTDLHGDVVGTFSGTALVDSVAYDPFGTVTHRSGAQRALGYQGEYTDPDTGKINMHARWYQPGTGAFVSRDDWTLNPEPSVQANRYTYANASPLVGIDPTGHLPFLLAIPAWKLAVAAVAAVGALTAAEHLRRNPVYTRDSSPPTTTTATKTTSRADDIPSTWVPQLIRVLGHG
ncbi:RHS repeat-associated core domain-containing protein [Streptosporangium sp. NBC_01755]|uniref:RHS repeat-associated core domain-containing protein n=1 Tax=Streptosporangium sp. NBC_01755 TaxID=2975949 RepID=UPI002DDC4FC5|nr:RHS repeat-associated core domain-containing protein [Streptosporangium sp. NBC_01755]WSD00085.1 RHS repeat-associated core domain-containing protein [Streptosporangium sp. NBC_01755]